jgi:predicted RNA-binding Zn ribbon-like protein
MARKPAPGRLQRVADFVNTLDVEVGRDAFDQPRSLMTWLAERGLIQDPGGPVTGDELAKAIELREAFRGLLAANNGIGQVDLAGLNARTAELPLQVDFEDDGGVVLRAKGDGVEGALAEFIAVAFTAMTDGTWSRLKVCRDDTCRWAYYDRSKNRSGAWCSMEVCGNRAKARAYRARGGEGAS